MKLRKTLPNVTLPEMGMSHNSFVAVIHVNRRVHDVTLCDAFMKMFKICFKSKDVCYTVQFLLWNLCYM